MKNLILVDHPIVRHTLAKLRDKNTDSASFRGAMNELARLIAYEATRDLETDNIDIETPMAKMKCEKILDWPVIVSIMRAGNGMLDGLLSMMPFAAAGHIGIYRDKFINNTVEYYFKLPPSMKGKHVFLADPLLATGDTAVACVDRLKQFEVGPIALLCILTSKHGLEKLHHFHPDVKVYACAVEPEMSELGYLIPGLGDAGDRLYKTQ
ncbi:MAG: uracil phosphoribosyltransferase [Bdellovibrionales bacterium]